MSLFLAKLAHKFIKTLNYQFLFTSIGAGVAGTGSGFLVSPPAISSTLGQTSVKYTTQEQWQFLFKLSEKIFAFLKGKNKTDNLNNLIDWFIHNFKKSSYASTPLEQFKDLCSKELSKEDQMTPQTHVSINPIARLCFIGYPCFKGEEMPPWKITPQERQQLQYSIFKGNLKHWNSSLYKDLFNDWNKSNYDLWKAFETQHKNPTVETVNSNFESWTKTQKLGNDSKNRDKKEVVQIKTIELFLKS